MRVNFEINKIIIISRPDQMDMVVLKTNLPDSTYSKANNDLFFYVSKDEAEEYCRNNFSEIEIEYDPKRKS